MKSIRFIVVRAILFLLATFNFAIAQTQNARALNWFKDGLAEKEPSKKIAAYKKALELDSLFVEAMYNLGLAYKKQQNYQLAEKWFSKAYSTKPEKLPTDLKQQILVGLGKTYKKLGKLQESEEALKGAKAAAVDRSTRATISFELGRCLFDQGRYEDALAELREGQKLNSDKDGSFQSFMQLVENTLASQRLSAAIEAALTSGNTKQAQALLEEIRKKESDEKKIAALAAKVDSSIKVETNRNILAALYEQAQKETAAGNWEAAITTYETLLQQDGAYKDASAKLEVVRQQLTEKQIQAQLEEDYAAGMSARREQNWTAAILAFEKVLKVDEKFSEARQRLEEAERHLEEENTEAIVARYYADGVSALNRNDLSSALAALEKARRLNSRYRNVADLLKEIDQRLQQKSKPAALATVASEQIESLYQEAIAAAEQNDWMHAVIALEKVQLLQPNYRDAVTRLAEARTQLIIIGKNIAGESGSGSSLLAVGGAIAALVIFPLIGVAALAPATRARFYLLRGNLLAAAQLYEKILSRRPDRVKLYHLLANIYLLMRRHDEQAMKIYKTVLNLNLATQRRDEINAIVAQNYLTEGRTDSDAIAVLENALKTERLKHNHGQ